MRICAFKSRFRTRHWSRFNPSSIKYMLLLFLLLLLYRLVQSKCLSIVHYRLLSRITNWVTSTGQSCFSRLHGRFCWQEAGKPTCKYTIISHCAQCWTDQHYPGVTVSGAATPHGIAIGDLAGSSSSIQTSCSTASRWRPSDAGLIYMANGRDVAARRHGLHAHPSPVRLV